MSAPSFSPIATAHRKAPVSLVPRKHQSSAVTQSDANIRPKFQCPGCHETFAKWSPCLAHLREKLHVASELLDKKLNGGDFRRVQEMCATLAYRQRGGRERADSTSSADSLSSDSGGEDEDPSSTGVSSRAPSPSRKPAQPKSKLTLGLTQARQRSSVRQASSITRSEQRKRPVFDLRRLEERVIFRILTFLDVDSSRMLFLAMTITPKYPVQSSESRVRLWSVSSDPDSTSVPSSSPQSFSQKRVTTPIARTEQYQ